MGLSNGGVASSFLGNHYLWRNGRPQLLIPTSGGSFGFSTSTMPSHSPSPSLFASPTPEPSSTLRKSNLADSSAALSRSTNTQSSTFQMQPSSSSQHPASDAAMSTSSSRNRRPADSYQADNRPTKRRRADHSSSQQEPLVITLDDDVRVDADNRQANIVLPPIRDLLDARLEPASTSVPVGSRQQPIEIDEDAGGPDEPQPQSDDPMSMAQLLARQQEEQVGSQKSTGDKPISLRNLTCVICMDKPTDLTAASCGKCIAVQPPRIIS